MSAPSSPVREHRIPGTATLRALDVRNAAGSVTVRAVEGTGEVLVRLGALNGAGEQALDRIEPSVTGSTVRIAVPGRSLSRTPAVAVEVLTPPGAAVTVEAAAAEVDLQGRLGAVTVTTASGDVAVEHAGQLGTRTASGDVRLGTITGQATVTTASGDVRAARVEGPLEVRTASGDVTVGDAGTDVRVTTASGRVGIDRARSGAVQLRTASADATVGVQRGLRVWLDLRSVSGRLHSELDDEAPGAGGGGSADLTVVLQSVSGDLRLRRAAPEPEDAQPPAAGAVG